MLQLLLLQMKGLAMLKELTQKLRRKLSRVKRASRRLINKWQGKQFVHLLHIGKTGGSAVKYAIKEAEASSKHFAIHLHRHKTTLRDIPEGEKVIFLLRDPVSRFISGFNSRQRQGRPKYFNPWNAQEKLVFERFSTANQLALALSSDDVVEYEQARFAMGAVSHVKDGYWTWFESEEYFRSRLADIYFIGFQESLTEDFEVLKSRLGLPSALKLPSDDVHAHRTPEQLDRRLDDAAIENLRSWYIADYQFISLCHAAIDERPSIRSAADPASRSGSIDVE